jgi:hypothetical protein
MKESLIGIKMKGLKKEKLMEGTDIIVSLSCSA